MNTRDSPSSKLPCSPSSCGAEATEAMNSVLSEVFPENILSITSQQNIDCANVVLTTFFFHIQRAIPSLSQTPRNQD